METSLFLPYVCIPGGNFVCFWLVKPVFILFFVYYLVEEFVTKTLMFRKFYFVFVLKFLKSFIDSEIMQNSILLIISTKCNMNVTLENKDRTFKL